MRILTVADYYRHGAARVVEERAAALARRGHQVALLAAADPDRLGSEAALAAEQGLEPELIPYLPGERGLASLIGLARAYRRGFERLAAAGRFDAILFNQPLSGWAVLRSPAARRARLAYTFHSPWAEEWAIARGGEAPPGETEAPSAPPQGEADDGAPRRQAPGSRPLGLWGKLEYEARRWIEGRVLARSHRITLLSRFMQDELSRMHPSVAPSKVVLIPGGVDLDRFRPLDPGARRARKAALGIPPRAPLLLTVRRLVPRMGLHALLRAFRMLRADFPELHLVVGGAGPLEADLRRAAGELGIADHARFLGYVPEGALPGLYGAADLFVLPTQRLEGFGLVTVEALACGTPVAGTPVGATPEILREIDPRLVAGSTAPLALRDAAARVLALEPAQLRALGAHARRRVAALYDAERVAGALEALLDGLVRTPRRRPRRPLVSSRRFATPQATAIE